MCSSIVLSVSLHVRVLHTCRHMAEKSGVHHLSGYQLQTDGQFQRKCVSLLRKWEEWSVKEVHWKQLSRKCAGKWLQKNQEDLSVIHSSLLTDTSWLFLGPPFTKHTPHTCHTHPLHNTQDQQETHNKHLYLHTAYTHYTKAKSSNYHLFASITYMQIQSLGEDIR